MSVLHVLIVNYGFEYEVRQPIDYSISVSPYNQFILEDNLKVVRDFCMYNDNFSETKSSILKRFYCFA